MNYEELNALLKQAEKHINTGNFNDAETLTNKMLAELEKASGSIENQEMNEGEMLHCSALLTLANSASRKGDFQRALSLALSALDLTSLHCFPALNAKALNTLGNVYWYLSDFHHALEYYGKALNAFQELEDKVDAARVTANIGLVYDDLSDYLRALEYYGKALEAFQEQGNDYSTATVKANIGCVYLNLSDYPRAFEYFSQALDTHIELGDKAGVARVTANIGNVYLNLSDYSRALEHYGKALGIHTELGQKADAANVTGLIGVVYMNLSDYPLALEYYGKALDTLIELGDKANVARVTGNIGIVYSNLSDYSLALEYFSKALDIHIELGQKADAARNTGSIGIIYNRLSDYSRGLEYLKKALDAHIELGNKSDVATFMGNIGSLYAVKDFVGYDTTKSEEHLLKAIAMSRELGTKLTSYSYYKSLADLYKTQKHWDEYSYHIEKYHELYIEVQSEEATKQAQLMEHRRKIEEAERDRQVKLARFQEQEKILHNILPSQIAERMVAGEKTIADSHEHVSVFFSDIVGFTKLSQQVTAQELVGMLNGIFTQFDQIAREHGLEKIKTIGDAYMAVCGAPIPVANHAERTALFALDVAEFMKNYQTDSGDNVAIRIGLHTGSVVAGIIGENKFAYDMWGDAVNTASRMESHGEAGKIHVSEEFKQAFLLGTGRQGQPQESPTSPMSPTSPLFTKRGEIDIKGKGKMKTYFLEKA